MGKKKVLIIGGAGYIGSHVNHLLHKSGYDTIVLDNLSTGSKLALKHGLFIEGDMADTPLLDRVFKEYSIEAVMHFAAFIDVGESVGHPEKYYRNNVCNTLNLLNAMRRHSVNHFIFSSTAAIFGNPEKTPLDESHPCHPINPYGQSKLMVEKILHDFDHAYGLRSCCLRYFNAAGGDPDGAIKNYKKKESNLIPVILREIKKGNPTVTIFGTDYPTHDGTCLRDYIHIMDLGNAHILAMEQLFAGKPSDHYNLGNGKGFSVSEVIRSAEEITGVKVNVINGARRPGDPPILLADSKKAHDLLGWEPKYPELETMIKHAWDGLNSLTFTE